MTNDLVKETDGELSWGDDPRDPIYHHSTSISIEDRLDRFYLLRFRQMLHNVDPDGLILNSNVSIEDRRDKLLSLMTDQNDSATLKNAENVMVELIKEYDSMKQNGHMAMIVDGDGKSILPYSESTVVRYPIIREPGVVSGKFREAIHPGILSTLNLFKHEVKKRNIALEKNSDFSIEHVKNHESIRERVLTRLVEIGWIHDESCSGKTEALFVGKELTSVRYQSMNQNFSKSHLYAMQLVNQIVKKKPEGLGNICKLSEISPDNDEKHNWFVILVTYQ